MKGKGFDEAFAAASDGIKSDSDVIQRSSFLLFKALFDKNQALEKAVTFVAETIKSTI